MNILDDNHILGPGMLIEDFEGYARTLHLVKCPKCGGEGQIFCGKRLIDEICQACDGKGQVLMRESEFKVWEGK